MITLFTIPKAFSGHSGLIQTNAVRSWSLLPGCRTILFGEEEGVAETAAAFGALHVPDIALNVHGTPLVSDAFEQVRTLATTPLVAYVNTDIILDDTLLDAAEYMLAEGPAQWLLVGRRHDLDVTERLDFSPNWQDRLRRELALRGRPHGLSGMDYFVFRPDFPLRLPEFAVGRPGWDSWLIYKTRDLGIAVVDASAKVLAVHQNHPPAYRPYGAEARANARSAGGYYRMGTLRDADWQLTEGDDGRVGLEPNLLGKLLFTPPIRLLLAAKRYAQAINKH